MGKAKRKRKASEGSAKIAKPQRPAKKAPWILMALFGMIAVVATGMTVAYQQNVNPKTESPLGPDKQVLAYNADKDTWEYSVVRELGKGSEFQFDGKLCYFDENGLIRMNPQVDAGLLPKEFDQTAIPSKPQYPEPEDIVRFLDKKGQHARHDRMGTLQVNEGFMYLGHEFRAVADKQSPSGISIRPLLKPSTASAGKDRSIDHEEVTPETWRGIDLEIHKPDGSLAKIGLLRPLWWLERADAKVGGTIYLSMPEMGIDGDAQVKAITPCTADSRNRSPGSQVVTGKFEHENAIVLDLYFNNNPEDHLGVTPNHPLWSLDRDGWIEAGHLQIGEKLRTKDGIEAVLTSKSQQPGRHKVYNLEVHKDHTYYVSNLGILAHNSCAHITKPGYTTRQGSAIDPGLDDFEKALKANGINVLGRNVEILDPLGRVVGEVDIVTDVALIQYKHSTSSASAILRQIADRTEPFVKLPVVGFIGKTHKGGVRTVTKAQRAGGLVTNDLDELLDLIRP